MLENGVSQSVPHGYVRGPQSAGAESNACRGGAQHADRFAPLKMRFGRTCEESPSTLKVPIKGWRAGVDEGGGGTESATCRVLAARALKPSNPPLEKVSWTDIKKKRGGLGGIPQEHRTHPLPSGSDTLLLRRSKVSRMIDRVYIRPGRTGLEGARGQRSRSGWGGPVAHRKVLRVKDVEASQAGHTSGLADSMKLPTALRRSLSFSTRFNVNSCMRTKCA